MLHLHLQFFSYFKQLQSYRQRPKSQHQWHKYQHSTVWQSLSLTQFRRALNSLKTCRVTTGIRRRQETTERPRGWWELFMCYEVLNAILFTSSRVGVFQSEMLISVIFFS